MNQLPRKKLSGPLFFSGAIKFVPGQLPHFLVYPHNASHTRQNFPSNTGSSSTSDSDSDEDDPQPTDLVSKTQHWKRFVCTTIEKMLLCKRL